MGNFISSGTIKKTHIQQINLALANLNQECMHLKHTALDSLCKISSQSNALKAYIIQKNVQNQLLPLLNNDDLCNKAAQLLARLCFCENLSEKVLREFVPEVIDMLMHPKPRVQSYAALILSVFADRISNINDVIPQQEVIHRLSLMRFSEHRYARICAKYALNKLDTLDNCTLQRQRIFGM